MTHPTTHNKVLILELPNLENTFETFIAINFSDQTTAIDNWHNYINNMRQILIPLIDDLNDKNLIKWHSFLVHNKQSGVPTTSDDNRIYFHLRLELSPDKSEEELLSNLPASCTMTRKMQSLSPYSIAGIHSEYLKNDDNKEAWKIIGDMSELVINIVKSHKDDRNLPIEHIAQFLHFPGNQLSVRMIRIPMP